MKDQSISPFEVDDAIVLLLGAPSKVSALKNEIQGITRLEKLMFLLDKQSGLNGFLSEELDFKSYNYGPFSEKIYQAIDLLSAAEIVEDSSKLTKSREEMWESQEVIGTGLERDPYVTRDIKLTERGLKYYDILSKELPSELVSEISEIKSTFGGLPLRKLVRYVYENFPEYTDKSHIREQVLSK